MTRRKAITASINNVKRAKRLKEYHTQTVEPEDNGEIVLWNDVLVEESEERRKKVDNKDEDFLLYEDHCRLRHFAHRGHLHLHCGDLRLRRKGFRRGIHFLPVLYPLRFVRGPSLGNTFLPGLVGRPPSQCGQHLHCQRPRIALRDGKLLQQCRQPRQRSSLRKKCIP